MMGGMEIRKAGREDIDTLMSLFARAREYMVSYGNTHQWSEYGWPPREVIERDVASGDSYVIVEGKEILATFYFVHGEHVEPCYDAIHDGYWEEDVPYGVIHRIASSGKKKGMLAFAIEFALARCPCLRMDTHEANLPMRHLMEKLGFAYRGIIYVKQDKAPRLAFELRR